MRMGFVNIFLLIVSCFRIVTILSMNQYISYKVGVKLCALRCFMTGSCVRIKLDTGTLHCELIMEQKRKRNKTTMAKLYLAIWKSVPYLECKRNHRLIRSKTQESRCVAVFQRNKCTPGMNGGMNHSRCVNGTYRCIPGFINDHKRNNCIEGYWGSRCSARVDCVMDHFICISRTCQCKVGLSYDPQRNKCVKDCRKYGTKFTFYDGYSIKKSNNLVLRSLTLEECQHKCISVKNFTCKSVDFGRSLVLSSTYCCLSAKGYLDVDPTYHERAISWRLGVRNCVQ